MLWCNAGALPVRYCTRCKGTLAGGGHVSDDAAAQQCALSRGCLAN